MGESEKVQTVLSHFRRDGQGEGWIKPMFSPLEVGEGMTAKPPGFLLMQIDWIDG